MDRLKLLFLYAGGRFRKQFFMSVPENEKEYVDSRNSYVVAETATMMTNELAGGTFLVAVLNYVQISDGFSGIIRSVGTIAALFQLLTMNVVNKMKKHKLFIFFCVLQRVWLGFLFFIPGMNLSRMTKCILIVGIYVYTQIMIQLANPAAVSLIASLVPEQIRGTYFSKKESIGVFLTFISLFFAGLLFDATKIMAPLIGFRILGSVIMVLALVDAFYIARMKEPKNSGLDRDGKEVHGRLVKKKAIPGERNISLHQEVLETFHHKGFQVALILNGIWTAAVYIATPFNASYQVKELGFSYTYITIVGLCTMMIRVYLMPRMGKLADKIGNEPVLTVMLSIMGLHHFIMMLAVPENGKLLFTIAAVVSATAWSYISPALLAIQLNVLDVEKRTIQYTVLSASSGIIGFFTSFLGGNLLEFLQGKEIMSGAGKLYAQQVMNLLAILFILLLVGYLTIKLKAFGDKKVRKGKF